MNADSCLVQTEFILARHTGAVKPRIGLTAFLLLLPSAALSGEERPLVFDPNQSTVDVVVKATFDSFTARLDAYQLTGRVDDAGGITSARLEFHFRDVLTGKLKRDAAMHDWQHTREFPDATFVLDSLAQRDGVLRAFGRLTLHGVTRELDFPVTVAHDGDIYAVSGDAPVDTRGFGLPVIRVFGVLKVDPVVHVRFHFQGHAT